MKKVFFLALGLTLFVSCSNDSEGNQPEINTVNFQTKATTLQTTYDQMLSSDSWIKYDKALGVFLEKMNCNDVSAFDSTTAMNSWLSSNIGSTGFASFQDAINQMDEVSNLDNIAYENNLSFFNALDGSTVKEIHDVIFNPYPQQPAGCQEECKKTLDGCSSSATTTYAVEAKASVALIKQGKVDEGNKARFAAFAKYESSLKTCNNSYIDCVADCVK